MSHQSLVIALALRLKPYRQVELQGAPNPATVEARSGDAVGNQKGTLHRPSRTVAKRDLCLKKLRLRDMQKMVQENPCGFSPPVAPQPPDELSRAEIIMCDST